MIDPLRRPRATSKAQLTPLPTPTHPPRQAAKKRFDEDPAFEEASRAEVVKLQGGDAGSLRAWRAICAMSRVEFQKIYDMLGVRLEVRGRTCFLTFDALSLYTHVQERGESFYNPMLEGLVQELEAKGAAVPSEGASCVFVPGYTNQDGTPQPLIVRKSDGGFLYATTDLAAIRQRTRDERADRVLYVTDVGQAQHFEMVFKVPPGAVRTLFSCPCRMFSPLFPP